MQGIPSKRRCTPFAKNLYISNSIQNVSRFLLIISIYQRSAFYQLTVAVNEWSALKILLKISGQACSQSCKMSITRREHILETKKKCVGHDKSSASNKLIRHKRLLMENKCWHYSYIWLVLGQNFILVTEIYPQNSSIQQNACSPKRFTPTLQYFTQIYLPNL